MTNNLINEEALIAATEAFAAIVSFDTIRGIIRAYEKAKFGRHYHVAHTEGDRCAACGYDLRDDIHFMVERSSTPMRTEHP